MSDEADNKYFTMEELTGMSADDYNKIRELQKRFKPFSIEAANSGQEIYTRDGRRVRVLCTDRRGMFLLVHTMSTEPMPVVALVPGKYDKDCDLVECYTADGHCSINYRFGMEDELDLFVVAPVHERLLKN